MRPALLGVLFGICGSLISAQTPPSFLNYESPLVHPLRISSDGTKLFAADTAENRLVVFSLANPDRPFRIQEIPVGLEPVSVAQRTGDEIWVVNHLSDSVSIVSLNLGRVVATLRVRDEPSDVVFANNRAFVSSATTDSVQVFDVTSRNLISTIPIFGKDPRALAVDSTGSRVFALVHRSGNGTTLLRHTLAPQPSPPPGLSGVPQQGLIYAANNPAYATQTPFTLPDYDLAIIDPVAMSVTSYVPRIGTTNVDLVVNPNNNEIFVANIDSRNLVRFENVLRGHAIDSRITKVVLGNPATVTVFDLNPGVNYSMLPNPSALSTALAEPNGLALDATAGRLYVAAQGTDRIGVLNLTGTILSRIEIGSTPGTTVNTRQKRGPRALALSTATSRLYVLNKLSSTIVVVNTTTEAVGLEFPLGSFDPVPLLIRDGRKFLYDCKLSGNGTMSCASCHMDGDMDGIAWDLGSTIGLFEAPPTQQAPFNQGLLPFHPMKGPMVTQTFKGLGGTSPLHWRGDKADFQAFNGAFDSLLGGAQIPTADMDLYASFATSITYPPNPNQLLNRSYATTPSLANQAAGFNAFVTPAASIGNLGFVSCSTCHTMPLSTSRNIISTQITLAPQQLKAPHLRNIYRKTGFSRTPGPQKSGFGFSHDGGQDTLANFLQQQLFIQWPSAIKDDLGEFLMAVDTGTAPTVGYQVTLNSTNVAQSQVVADVNLLIQRALASDIDLVAKGTENGEPRSFLYQTTTQLFTPDAAASPAIPLASLTSAVAAGSLNLTLTGVARGTGRRIAIDRDLDGILDGDDGLVRYGNATAGCQGVPFLDGNSEPRVGNADLAITCRNAPPGASALLVIGFAQAAFPFNGATILVDVTFGSPIFVPLTTQSDGTFFVPTPVPNIPALIGGQVYVQAAFLDSCAPQQMSTTRGLRVTVQP